MQAPKLSKNQRDAELMMKICARLLRKARKELKLAVAAEQGAGAIHMLQLSLAAHRTA